MKTLFVLHDGTCGLCWACRDWLKSQRKYVELRFIPMQSSEVRRRFPGIEKFGLGEDLIVVSDQGAVYRNTSAWIMCLYALVEYRGWALRLSHPAMLPLARKFFLMLSKQRGRLSRWFIHATPQELHKHLEAVPTTCSIETEQSRAR